MADFWYRKKTLKIRILQSLRRLFIVLVAHQINSNTWNTLMAVFVDLWSWLFHTKLWWAQLFKWGHSNVVMSYTTTLLHFLKITGWIIRSLSLPCGIVLSPSDEICIHCYQIFLVLHNLQCSFVCQVSTCDILVTGPQKTSWFCLIDFSIWWPYIKAK